jgi:hypothetical protein
MIKNVKLQNIILETNRTFQDGYEDDYEDDYFDQYGKEDSIDDEISEEEEEDNLGYLIRTFLNARGITSYVETDGKDVIIYVYLNRKEKIKNLTKIFDVILNNMKTQMFEDYDLETELYETKEGEHIFSFTFYADGSVDKDDYSDVPF